MSTPVAEVLARVASIVGPGYLLTDADSRQRYGGDYSRTLIPNPVAVALPGDVDQVQALVRLARSSMLALVPSGGRTGLSGGCVAAKGELVVALDRFNQIHQFNAVDRSLRCGAGVITRQVQDFAADRGLFYPVDFASSGSSQLGGNVATNAGGIKVIRYGMTRDWVAGIQLVSGTGDVLELNRGLVKNNAGYDLRQLVIGSEGTLGIITEITLRLCKAPRPLRVMVLAAPSMQAIMETLSAFAQDLELSAFEFFSEAALEKVVRLKGLARPFSTPAPYYALLEFEESDGSETERALQVFEHCTERGHSLDGVISQSESQARSLWRLREDISETLSRWLPYKNDLSVTVSKVPDFLADVEAFITAAYTDFEIIWYGHIGDGNVHLNILKPEQLALADFQQRCAGLSRGLSEIVQHYGGSVSAEHGVGLLKKDQLPYSRCPAELALMRQIKQAFDPDAIMNPGKIFNPE